MKKMRNHIKNIQKGITAILFAVVMVASVLVGMPAASPIEEPITEPIEEPITEPITEPIVEPPIEEPIEEPPIEEPPIEEPIEEPPIEEPIEEPPDISVTVSPDTLWPPNHKMVDITATVTVSDICDVAPSVVLTSVTCNEPDDAKGKPWDIQDSTSGDGSTVSDIQGADIGTMDYEFQLRAERAGKGDGRIYTIVYTVTDASGNSASASATVVVPLDVGE
jgi:hypothetical protein